PGEAVALGLPDSLATVSGPSLTAVVVLSPASPVSPGGSTAGQPDLGASADVAIALTAAPVEMSFTPERLASRSQHQPVQDLSSPPPLAVVGEDGAFALVADEGRRRALTAPVLGQSSTALEGGLLTEDLFTGPVAALRPPQ